MSDPINDPSPQKKPRGRPRHEPTEETRTQVRFLAGMGMTHEAISRRVGISHTTLNNYYRDELTRGQDEINVQVATSLYNMATGREIQDDGSIKRCSPNPGVAIFWAKTRMGWKEPPSVLKHVGSLNLTDLSTEDLQRELDALRSRRGMADRIRAEDAEVPDGAAGLLH